MKLILNCSRPHAITYTKQVINTFSANKGEVITLFKHKFEDQNANF